MAGVVLRGLAHGHVGSHPLFKPWHFRKSTRMIPVLRTLDTLSRPTSVLFRANRMQLSACLPGYCVWGFTNMLLGWLPKDVTKRPGCQPTGVFLAYAFRVHRQTNTQHPPFMQEFPSGSQGRSRVVHLRPPFHPHQTTHDQHLYSKSENLPRGLILSSKLCDPFLVFVLV